MSSRRGAIAKFVVDKNRQSHGRSWASDPRIHPARLERFYFKIVDGSYHG
jgi:hypothetical protein